MRWLWDMKLHLHKISNFISILRNLRFHNINLFFIFFIICEFTAQISDFMIQCCNNRKFTILWYKVVILHQKWWFLSFLCAHNCKMLQIFKNQQTNWVLQQKVAVLQNWGVQIKLLQLLWSSKRSLPSPPRLFSLMWPTFIPPFSPELQVRTTMWSANISVRGDSCLTRSIRGTWLRWHFKRNITSSLEQQEKRFTCSRCVSALKDGESGF